MISEKVLLDYLKAHFKEDNGWRYNLLADSVDGLAVEITYIHIKYMYTVTVMKERENNNYLIYTMRKFLPITAIKCGNPHDYSLVRFDLNGKTSCSICFFHEEKSLDNIKKLIKQLHRIMDNENQDKKENV